MLLALDYRRQSRVCSQLADDCDDRRLAERLRAMARDLLAKADDFEEPTGGEVKAEQRLSLAVS